MNIPKSVLQVVAEKITVKTERLDRVVAAYLSFFLSLDLTVNQDELHDMSKTHP
jgi:hypothetical protein